MATYTGSNRDDVIIALGSGANVLRSLGGDDSMLVGFTFDPEHTFTRLNGGSGADFFGFVFSEGLFFDDDGNPLPGTPSTGSVVIEDFTKGQDKLGFYEESNNNSLQIGFYDSNRDGVLTDADEFVQVKAVTVDGVAKLSTILDTTVLPFGEQGDQKVVLFGVTGLTLADGVALDDWPSPPTSVAIVGTSAAEELRGSDFDDRIDGRGGDDLVNGDGGADILRGGPGNDRRCGGAGADKLEGGVGNDLLDGGAANDRLEGDDGSDVFRTSYRIDRQDAGTDAITDFLKGEDKIGLDASFGLFGSPTFDGGDLFAFLDSNDDNVLTHADEHVRVKNATIDGVTKVSTYFDVGAFADVAAGTSGPWSDDQVLVFGATGLQASDFTTGPATT
jgi:Ca2+-binding RTX toxin-like protein